MTWYLWIMTNFSENNNLISENNEKFPQNDDSP